MTDIQPVLVTGATGKTGRHTVRFLRKSGLPVRALVHRYDERSRQLQDLGAEVAVGDLLDLDAMTAATRGVRSAYFTYPIRPGLIEATTVFAQAAADNGVEAVVNMSQISARREAASNAARHHWLAERLLDHYPVPTTHLRPTFFAEWLLTFGDWSGREGLLRLPMGQGRHAPIAAEDQGRVIAAILTDPAPHAGRIYPLHGPQELDYDEIAAAAARALERPVRYEPVDIDTFVRTLQARGWHPHTVQHLRNVVIDYQNGIFAGTNNVVRDVGGTEPLSVEAYVARHRDAMTAH
ncbi:NmrA family NAD(P)-binding protein [Streptomyces chiangmaiensis]|uniref:NmrA family NAD(P)-binding protein n=2 Tax=Streptomyces chiangmaiensis TaxID=766497 RepID=A0ABU7FXX8_9ACTN|nr:NmrA family NAD(P)-binding protein [Streptomyces chiangmaiensis]MED7828977.1 NmrA family NAD(P)-binding protein [Streptomyces chiangmaiensis]